MQCVFFIIILIFSFANCAQKPNKCGLADKPDGSVYGGSPITRGEWPWLVALFVTENNLFFCGGTLISLKNVLTAAHCIHPKHVKFAKKVDEFFIYLGKHNLSFPFERSSQISYPTHVVLHEDYSSVDEKFDADLAIITLEHEVVCNSYIAPICLWTSQSDLLQTNGIMVGWGVSETSGWDNPEKTPKKLSMSIVFNEDCFLEHYQLSFLSSKRTFCASAGTNKGPCKGDSGSGFYLKHNERWYLRGFVSAAMYSFDSKCDVTLYSIFTNVLKFTDWILSHTSKVIDVEMVSELNIITRQQWNARDPKPNVISLKTPNSRIMIAHTVTSECDSEEECSDIVKTIQTNHMRKEGNNFNDIWCNFLIGGDGLIYEGRGWKVRGEHTVSSVMSHNDAVCVAFIGDFTHHAPRQSQIDALFKLLQNGVSNGMLVPNYKINAQRDFHASLSPGQAFYDVIKKWPQYANTI